MTHYRRSSVKVQQDDDNKNNNIDDRNGKEENRECVLTDYCREHPLLLLIIMEDSPSPLFHQRRQRSVASQIINRHNVKLVIRILVGLALVHIVGHRFPPIHAAPSSTKSNWKNRPQKVQPTTLSNGTSLVSVLNTGRLRGAKRIAVRICLTCLSE